MKSAACGSTACGTSPTPTGNSPKTYSLIHQLQPGALIVSNHHKTPFPGEDYQTFEKDLPGDNTTGWGGAAISQLPLETSDTMYRGGSWGFNLRDTDPKSLRDLIQYLVRAAGNNANFLLNVGPHAQRQKSRPPSPTACARWAHG